LTNSEFIIAEQKARENYLKITKSVYREIAALYRTAADEVAAKILELELSGKGNSLTAASNRALQKTLIETGQRISDGVEKSTINGISDVSKPTNKPHIDFINDASILAGGIFDPAIIEKMYSQINTVLIDLTYTRIWSDGYTFSNKIWGYPGTPGQPYLPGLGEYWRANVNNLLTLGFMQNKDLSEIADSLTVYANKGRGGIVKRYGELPISIIRKRIPKRVDWRAMRLARSELYISLQESSKIQGKNNPAVRGYDWNLTGGRGEWDCPCPDLAANSPYDELHIPGFPHPNCLCHITHRLMNRNDFVNDLVLWNQGFSIPYLDTWYMNQYLPAA